jgi:hypothetical protein
MEDLKMLSITDCGCDYHHPRKFSLTGLIAALMDRLVCNLPVSDQGYTYICEHGQTHCLILQSHATEITKKSEGSQYRVQAVSANLDG